MAIATSSVPTARANIYSAVVTQVNDPSVLVCYDEPGEYQPDDIVSVGQVDRTVTPYQMVGSGGTGWLDEEYRVLVVVSVFRGGDNAKTVWDRAWTLIGNVETAVRTDPSLAGAVEMAWPSHTLASTVWSPDHKGYMCTAEIEVFCRHRI